MREQILLVDDDPLVRNLLKDLLWLNGYYVITAETGAAAWRLFEQSDFSLVLLDLQLPDVHGMHLLADFKCLKPQVPVLIFSGADFSMTQLDEAIQLGASGWLGKSFPTEKIIWEMQKALAERKSDN